MNKLCYSKTQRKCGRKRKTTPKDDTILRNSQKNPRKTSFDLQKDLVLAGVRISSGTVRHTLLEAGRKAEKLLKKHLSKQLKK